MNGVFPYSLKPKKRKNLIELFLNDNKNRAVYKTTKTNTNPIGTGYFPEDFSLNIYKSTSLYKKRYQIEPLRLKNQLKVIKIKKKSMKNEKIINKINKYITETSFSSDLFRLLKSKKIDRFVKRYLEKKNYLNDYNNRKLRKALFPKGNKIKENTKQIDEDKINNDDIIKQKASIHLMEIKNLYNKDLSDKNIVQKSPKHKIENKIINSSNKTLGNNKFEENKNAYKKQIFVKRPQSYDIIRNEHLSDSLKSYNNLKNNEKFNTIKIDKRKFSKKYLYLDKNQNVKIFSPRINKSDLINKFKTKRKLIFSYYDPNDEHIKLFKEFENKLTIPHPK